MSIHEPAWLKTARDELGTKRFGQNKSNPRIETYHQGTNIEGYDDKVAWCSSFVNWVLNQNGIEGTNSALARSWLDWGNNLNTPKLGCIVVLERVDPNGWQGHVGFYIGEPLNSNDQDIYLIGGNQDDAVSEKCYPLSSLLSYRWPILRSVDQAAE